MSTSAELNPNLNDLSSPSGQAMSTTNELTVHEINRLTGDNLLRWINQNLANPLTHEDGEKLVKARVDGEAFLSLAGNRKFFEKLDLAPGDSQKLAALAGKSKCCGHYTHCAGS